jgi:hypothetical protein
MKVVATLSNLLEFEETELTFTSSKEVYSQWWQQKYILAHLSLPIPALDA